MFNSKKYRIDLQESSINAQFTLPRNGMEANFCVPTLHKL